VKPGRSIGYWFPFRNADDTFRPGTADYPDWHQPVVVRNNRAFAVLTMSGARS
jgi:hypothetical protein